MAERVGQLLGNYRLLQELGRGSFAEVYLGEHLYLKRLAALKLLHVSLSDQQIEHFLAEAQILARLTHPAIVRVLEFFVAEGMPVLVMDYAPAGTLRQRYPEGVRLPLATTVQYILQLADALQYAHNHSVIHRDVKPENILLSAERRLLLSDQYALGVLTYEWLSGRRPFAGSYWQVIHQHLEESPPSLREVVPDLSEALEAVILRVLAKDPRDRFVSIQTFAAVLEQVCWLLRASVRKNRHVVHA